MYKPHKTGFAYEKDFKPEVGSLIAGRYEVRDYLGSAAFSSAYGCYDRETDAEVCLKVVRNEKQVVDQSLDEIKVLLYLNHAGDCDEAGVLNMYDFFYCDEHLFIVTEVWHYWYYDYDYGLDNGVCV